MSRPGPVARLLVGLVHVYQHVVSPLRGPSCRFQPTCSSYAADAVRVHGAGRGGALALWRLLRCQPFGTPGWDPVPEPGERLFRRGTSETPTRPESRTAAALRGAGQC